MRRRDLRLPAAVLTTLLVATLGLAFGRLSGLGPETPLGTAEPLPGGATGRPARPAAAARETAIDRLFREAAVLLHARRHAQAADLLQRLLRLAPRMPEAHVNMGFALLGLGRPRAARDAFQAALALRRAQINAYYGLAVALEALGDLPAARGAMRTYVHLSSSADPFRRKAMAALWEWQNAKRRDSRN